MTMQKRLTKEFEIEAVRLARTSGRTQRQVVEDLGIGLSTLVRWIGLTVMSARRWHLMLRWS